MEAYPYLLKKRGKPIEPFYSRVTAKRPGEELYDLGRDPDELVNVADQPAYADTKQALASRLRDELLLTGDPLEMSGRDAFSAYKYWWPD